MLGSLFQKAPNKYDINEVMNEHSMRSTVFSILAVSLTLVCSQSEAADVTSRSSVLDSYTKIYWSDGDSGRLGQLKFRLANKDAPETGSMKQRGGAKCEYERELGYAAKAYVVGFTKDKTIRIARDYGEDRYGRLVVDLEANGADVGTAAVDAGHLRDWPHINGRARYAKPDWCARR